MGLFDIFNSKKKKEEEEAREFLKAIFQYQANSRADAVDADTLPTGYGEFGLCVTNPIPTMSVLGSNAYLSALRTSDNKATEYNRIGSTRAPEEVTTAMIDMYAISCNGNSLATIYICPYHKRNSTKAPMGFRLAR